MVSGEKLPILRGTSQNNNSDSVTKKTNHGTISPGPGSPLGSNECLDVKSQTADRVEAGGTGQQENEGAIAKGMSQTAIGLVFSCYELWVFIASPIVGNYIVRIGARFAFIAGQFLAGGCSILFGTTYMVAAGDTFITLTFVLRSVMALGAAGFSTASFSLAAYSFPDQVSVVYAVLEVFTGVGYMLGPVLGGFLYDLGGFGLPFYSSGSFLVLLSIITYFTLSVRNDNLRAQKRQGSVLSLLASPLIVVCCVTLVSGTYTFGFMDASLAIHLHQFHISASVTGLCFMSVAALYSLSSPLYGWLSDKKNLSFPLLIIGSLTVCVSLLLLGPSPLLPFLSADLGLAIFSLILLGCGNGAIIIPVVKCFYIGARRLGFKDGLDLDGLLSGLLTSTLHLGTFLGPTIGSSVMEATSYEWSTTLNAGFCFFSFLLLIAYKAVERWCLKYDDDDKPSRSSRADSPNIVLHTSDTNGSVARPAHDTVLHEEREF
ncbi:MFS-type transporter SLC18B1-like isoform X2 [Babylonia areolata]|uniref:MFS-type transporter SLC18B1-like isoform X2 n=1 Tax=Babylonia areolata TaxID=304850 RepID=UPI003FD0FD89